MMWYAVYIIRCTQRSELEQLNAAESESSFDTVNLNSHILRRSSQRRIRFQIHFAYHARSSAACGAFMAASKCACQGQVEMLCAVSKEDAPKHTTIVPSATIKAYAVRYSGSLCTSTTQGLIALCRLCEAIVIAAITLSHSYNNRTAVEWQA